MTATLRKKGWLFREWMVATPADEHIVSYDGRRFGFEFVLVDGNVAVKTRSWVWFVPKFEFQIGEFPARIDVQVWPWFVLRAVRLRVADEDCYSEGLK